MTHGVPQNQKLGSASNINKRIANLPKIRDFFCTSQQ